MTTDSRHVRVLQLDAYDRAGAERGGRMVAQALRTATFPGDGLPGRLLIRSLECELATDADSGDALARSLSASLARAWADAAVLHAPQAAQSKAVRVRAEIEVYLELARQALRAEAFALRAWFWPLLLGPQRMALCADRSSALQVALAALLEPRQGPPALATLLDLALADGSADRLLASLPPAWGPALLREAGIHALPEAATAERVGPAPPTTSVAVDSDVNLDPDLRALLVAFTRDWGSRDARSLWLCFAVLWRALPGSAAVPGLEGRVQRLLRALDSPPLLRARPGDPHTRAVARAPDERQTRPEPPDKPTGKDNVTTSPPTAATTSRYAGLLFVWPILLRLDLHAFLRDHPELAEIDLVRRVLARLAARLEVPADDPILTVLSAPCPAREVRAFTLPPSWWPDAAQTSLLLQPLSAVEDCWVASLDAAVPLALWHGTPPAPVCVRAGARRDRVPYPAPDGLSVLLDAWTRGVTRWLAHNTELDLRALVQRSARVAITRTHIDILFDLNAADIRVRKAALDLNPGYVPHLGRVVTFHYSAA